MNRMRKLFLLGILLISVVAITVGCGSDELTSSEAILTDSIINEAIEEDIINEAETTNNITITDGMFDPFEGLKIRFYTTFDVDKGSIINFNIEDSNSIYDKDAYTIQGVNDSSRDESLSYGDTITVEVNQEYVDDTIEEIGALPSRMTKDFIIEEGDYYFDYDEMPEDELNEKINSIKDDIYEINKMTCTPPDWINVSGYSKLSFVGSGFKILDNSVKYVGSYFFTRDKDYVEEQENRKDYNEMYLVFHVDVSYYIPGSHCINQKLLLDDFYYVVEIFNIKIDRNQNLIYWVGNNNPEEFSSGIDLFNGQERVGIASFDIPNDDDFHYTWSLYNICPTLKDLNSLVETYLSEHDYLTLVGTSL